MRKILGKIQPCEFQGKFLIAIEKRWKDFFIGDLTFEVVIKDGKLNLYGPKLNLDPHRDHPAAKQEDIADG